MAVLFFKDRLHISFELSSNRYQDMEPSLPRGGSRMSGKRFICIKVWVGGGGGFALLTLSHFSSISHENEIILSH